MRPPSSRPPAAAGLSLGLPVTVGACDSRSDRAERVGTTTSAPSPAQGDPGGANTGAGGDAGGTGAAVDPGGE